MASVAELAILITAKDEASKAMSGIGDAIGKVAIAAGAAAAVGALGVALKGCVEEAMAAEQVLAATNAVLTSTKGAAGMSAEAIGELAQSLSEVTMFEDDVIQAGENLLLTFTNIGKDVFPDATKAMLNISTAMGTDLKSSAIQLGKALNDPIEGLSALTRVGVSFTEEQKGMIEALMGGSKEMEKLTKEAQKAEDAIPGLSRDLAIANQKLKEMEGSGKASTSQLMAQRDAVTTLEEKLAGARSTISRYDGAQKEMNNGLSQSERMMRAQQIILGELDREFGGAAEAAGKTFAGQLQILQNAFGNVKEEIGAALLPILSTLVSDYGPRLIQFAKDAASWFTTTLIPAVSNLATWLQTNLAAAIEFVTDNMNTIQPILIAVAAVVGTVLVAAFVAWAAAAATAAAATLVALAPILVPIAAIGAAVALLVAAWENNWGGMRDTLTGIWEGNILPIVEQLRLWLETNIPVAIQVVTDYWNNTLLPAINAVWGFIQTNLIPLFEALANLLSVALSVAITALTGLWQKVLLPAIREVYNFIQSSVLPIFQSLVEKLEGPIAKALDFVRGLFDKVAGAISAISGAIQSVIGWINDMANALSNIKLPSWLTPGSPTPFEMGLWGIVDALQAINTSSLPQFSSGLGRLGSNSNGGSSSSNTYNVVVNTNASSGTYLADIMMARALAGT